MTKQEIREAVWEQMEQQHVARFPGARGRIPNFTGAEQCALMIGQHEAWKSAKAIKSNPDSPQRAIRHLALKEGKTVYMAVPRLREEKCFVELDPVKLTSKKLWEASSIKGAFEHGGQVTISRMKPIDLVVCGSVAVRRDGARLGKGGGYSDLEYALTLEAGKLNKKTPIITTVHPVQIVDYEFELRPHDIPVDFIVTPDETIDCRTRLRRPIGVYWEYLNEEQIEAIPVLSRLRRKKAASSRAHS